MHRGRRAQLEQCELALPAVIVSSMALVPSPTARRGPQSATPQYGRRETGIVEAHGQKVGRRRSRELNVVRRHFR